jgi:hypothetical protein
MLTKALFSFRSPHNVEGERDIRHRKESMNFKNFFYFTALMNDVALQWQSIISAQVDGGVKRENETLMTRRNA